MSHQEFDSVVVVVGIVVIVVMGIVVVVGIVVVMSIVVVGQLNGQGFQFRQLMRMEG